MAKIGNTDFNPQLGNLTAPNFASWWKKGKWQEKTGKTAEEAQAIIKGEKPKKTSK